MISLILIIGLFLAILIILNRLYKKTNAYHNLILMNLDFICKSPSKIMIFGSTYARYAFDGIKSLKLNAYNLTYKSQSIDNDLYNLKKHIQNIESGGIVFICLAPCTLLYGGMRTFQISVLKVAGNLNASFKQKCDYIFPIIHPKRIIKIIFDESALGDIYGNRKSISDEIMIEREMKQLVDIWCNLFSISDLKTKIFSKKNTDIISLNKNKIAEMIVLCESKKLKTVIIVPPFSQMLNKYFSVDFIENTLEEPVRQLCEKHPSTIYLNYRTDAYFQNEAGLFLDGGFLLNRRGSHIFIKKISKDLIVHGIEITNNTVGMF